jgi:Ca2+ transporting ATPase
MAIFLAISCTARRMKLENILVKNLKLCEILGNVTTICLDITGLANEESDHKLISQVIQDFQNAGILLIFITSDSFEAVRSFAEKYTIIKTGQSFLVLSGREFNDRIRNTSGEVNQQLFDEIWPHLRVLAQSSSKDKYLLVKHIMESNVNTNREVVAVIGVEERDRQALKIADIGLTLGISGSEAAKESSNIILIDDKISNIVRTFMWGRNANEIISKFLQFHLTINLVVVLIDAMGVCLIEETPSEVFQILWLNIMIGTLGALALATDKPNSSLMSRKPIGSSESLISRIMLRNIIGHSIYQIVVINFFIFFGQNFFDIDSEINTIILNTFAIMTILNLFNCRMIDEKTHCFKGLLSNPLFFGILFIALIIHIVVAQFIPWLLYTSSLIFQEWLWSFVFGIGALLWGQIIAIIFSSNCFGEKINTNVSRV